MHSDMQGPQERCFFSWFVSGYAKDFPGTLSGTRSGKTRARAPGPMNPRKQKRWGFPERRLHGKPRQECLRRRVTLPHPAGCSTITVPGLSFRVRKGTGRHTWAMATAKTTINGPDPQKQGTPTGQKENHPRAATGACRDGPGTGQRTRTPFRDHRNNAPCRQQSRSSKDADPPPHTGGNGLLCRRRPLVPVGSTPRGASTSGLSNTCSTCGLQDPEGPKES